MTRPRIMTYPWEDLAEEYHQRGFRQTDVFGYGQVEKLLGDIQGKTILDFGCGDGKFSRYMAENMGANVLGVDTSDAMIALAMNQKCPGVAYRYVDKFMGRLPCAEESIDKAVATFVFCTMWMDMVSNIQQIYRSLRSQGTFTILEPNPISLGKEFVSMRSEADENFQSGKCVKVYLDGMEGPIFNFWRTKEDTQKLLQDTGFTIDHVLEPVLNPRRFIEDIENGIQWKDEHKYPPFYVIHAKKSNTE